MDIIRDKIRGEQMTDVTKEAKTAVIDMLLAQWRQTLYSHTVQMRVFDGAGFDEMKAQATASAERAQVVIDGLEGERAAIKAKSESPAA